MTGAPCSDNCSCYYNVEARVNVFDCSESGLIKLPSRIQEKTNWINVHGNYIRKLCEPIKFSQDVTMLNLSFNQIGEICPEFTASLVAHGKVRFLDLSENNLKYLPTNIQEAKHFTKIWLGGNSFVCDCSMLWMPNWVANFTLISSPKEHVVQDYQNITCANILMAGKPIYLLNQVEMGCFPDRLPAWAIALLATGGFVITVISIVMYVLFRHWDKCKFCLYRNVLKTQKGDLKDKHAEALLSYRYIDYFINV